MRARTSLISATIACRSWRMSLAWLDETDNRRLARQMLKISALADAAQMVTIANYARAGWDLADEALREFILEFENAGKQKPTYLSAYNMEIVVQGLVPQRVPGPKKADNFLRDIVIASTVEEVAKKFSLKPTRSRFSPRPSACSVVADALVTAEETVVTIWKRYGAPNLVL